MIYKNLINSAWSCPSEKQKQKYFYIAGEFKNRLFTNSKTMIFSKMQNYYNVINCFQKYKIHTDV